MNSCTSGGARQGTGTPRAWACCLQSSRCDGSILSGVPWRNAPTVKCSLVHTRLAPRTRSLSDQRPAGHAQARALASSGSSCLIAPVRVSSSPEMDPPLQVRDTISGAKIVQRFATLVGVILAAVLPVNAVQSQSQSKEVMTLLRYEKLLDGICRSHIPDSPHAHDKRAAACCGRTLMNVRLNQLGWCYGKRGQTGADQRWHRCTRESHRNHPSNYCS